MRKLKNTGVPNDTKWHKEHVVEALDWSFLSSYIKMKHKNVHILDVGCGNGNSMLRMIELGYKNIQGIEYAKFMFKKALKDYPHLKIQQGDAEDLLKFADNSFDVIISSQVLEHLPHPEKALAESYRVLKKKGSIVIGIPNGYHLNDLSLKYIQLLFYGRCDHLQRFSKKKIKNLLSASGFEIEKIAITKGSLEVLKDPRIKRFSFITETILYSLIRKIYYSDISFNIIAVKR